MVVFLVCSLKATLNRVPSKTHRQTNRHTDSLYIYIYTYIYITIWRSWFQTPFHRFPQVPSWRESLAGSSGPAAASVLGRGDETRPQGLVPSSIRKPHFAHPVLTAASPFHPGQIDWEIRFLDKIQARSRPK